MPGAGETTSLAAPVRHPFRARNLRLRLVPVYAAALGLVALARPTPRAWLAGAAIVAGGLGLRLWAAGHLVKTTLLVRSGPYGYVRHPFYAGSFLIGLGLAVAAGSPGAWILAGVAGLVFVAYVLPYKERIESARLERRHGAAYRSYRASVPAWLPALRPPLRTAEASRWTLERVIDNDELGVLLGASLGLAALALRTSWPG